MSQRKPTLMIVRGLPGSGKSTVAKSWVAASHANRVRVSRDDLRSALYDGEGILGREQENVVTLMQREMAATALRQGLSVVVDDMNLRERYVKDWIRFAREHGANPFQMAMDTPLEECIARDRARGEAGGRTLGEEVIRGIASRFRFPTREVDPATVEDKSAVGVEVVPYVPNDESPAYIFDIDGTLALNTGGRGFYDWHRVGEDTPNPGVVALAKVASLTTDVIVVSGRDEVCREQTRRWLNAQGIYPTSLFMRAEGDQRKDSVVKSEIFDAEIRDRYNVLGVIDDRQQVVDFWRSIGLTCFQVAPGDF